MASSKRTPNAIRAVEIKARELALEDSLRGAASAVASDIKVEGNKAGPHAPTQTYPFELALAQQVRDADLRFGTLFEHAPAALVVLSTRTRPITSRVMSCCRPKVKCTLGPSGSLQLPLQTIPPLAFLPRIERQHVTVNAFAVAGVQPSLREPPCQRAP